MNLEELKTIANNKKPYLEWDVFNEHDEGWAESAWEFLLDNLQELLEAINPGKTKKWIGVVENFGWMKQSGRSEFTADDAEEFLNKILPRTENTYKIFVETRPEGTYYIKIQNWHHDSPAGDEFYSIFPDSRTN